MAPSDDYFEANSLPLSGQYISAVQKAGFSTSNEAWAATQAASKFGCPLHPDLAEAIAKAVLAYLDEVIQYIQLAPAHFWEQSSFRENVRSEMRRHLIADVLRSGKLPVALPTERVNEHRDPLDKNHGMVTVTLSVPVRKSA